MDANRRRRRLLIAAMLVDTLGGGLSLLSWTNAWGYALGAFLLSTNMRVFWAAFTPLVVSIASGAQLEQWFGRLRGARYIGIVLGEALSGLVFVAGVHTGLRLLVIANGISFVAALALVLATAPPRRALAGNEPEQAPGHGGYREVLRDRVNLALAAL